MRITQQEIAPLKRENNGLKQEMKLLQAQAQKAERRSKELALKLKNYEEKKGPEDKEGMDIFPLS